MDDEEGNTSSGLVRRTLFRGGFTCLLRADHPMLKNRKRLSLDLFTKLSHAMVSLNGEGPGPVDRLLAKNGRSRRILLRVPTFSSAVAIVARSDLVLTAPAVLAGVVPSEMNLVALPPPLPIPDHSVDLVWHERFTSDRGHTWLRGLLADIARGMQSKTR